MITELKDPEIWAKLYAELKDDKFGFVFNTSVNCPNCESEKTGYCESFLLCHECASVVGISFTFPFPKEEANKPC